MVKTYSPYLAFVIEFQNSYYVGSRSCKTNRRCSENSLLTSNRFWEYLRAHKLMSLKQYKKIAKIVLVNEFSNPYDAVLGAQTLINQYKTKFGDLCVNKYQKKRTSNSFCKQKGREVNQFDLNGNLIAKYNTLREAQRLSGIPEPNIFSCCTGQTHTAGGFLWKFAVPNITLKHISKNIFETSKPVIQYNKLGDTILAEFPSLSEASRQTGARVSSISLCCSGKNKTAGGYQWAYK